MISQLTIQNFALIERLAIDFSSCLNIFTGETGAGKSILIDALRFCLGERLNTSQIRDSGKACIVEAVFELSDKLIKELPLLSEYICGSGPTIIITRSYLPDGRIKNKINDFNVTLSRLKEIGDHLVDFHGPHDHQMLLSENSHIAMLDKLCAMHELKYAYTRQYNIFLGLNKKLNDLRQLSLTSEREKDLLQYQINELAQVPLDAETYAQLTAQRSRLNNTERLYETVNNLTNILEDEETGIAQSITKAFAHIKTLNSIDETTAPLYDIAARIQEDSSELLSALNHYLDKLSFDPAAAQDINNRFNIYYEILRKYGPVIEDAEKFYAAAREKHSALHNLEYDDQRLSQEIKSAEKELTQTAQKLSAQRKKTAKILEESVEQELKELGMAHIQFECRLQKADLDNNGHDKVSFYISPNAGEALKPMAEIVSSGEAARVMLALKKSLTKADPIPVLIFDEIDAQIGGRLGNVTGKKLKEISQDRQIILITHLPQIASFADYHFKVSKKVKDNRTLINVDFLEDETRIKELAKMMSGEKESPIAVKHAEELFSRAKKLS